jgi:hypothetical protein
MKRFRSCLTIGIAGSVLFCLLAAGISALSNATLPKGPQDTSRLDELDKARLAEALHLKSSLGETIWLGWGKTDIPIIIWNHDYSFLVGLTPTPAGWEEVTGDDFQGQAYYRQRTNDPQNFAVKVGDNWVASMATKWETDQFMMGVFREMLPPVLEQVFPYRLMIMPSEVQMTGVLHETFHVYQTLSVPERLNAAEAAHKLGESYWQADAAMSQEWKAEIDLLAQALAAKTDQEATGLARQFLEQRQQRRSKYSLSSSLVAYEQWLEWEEGLAKYVELAAWQAAYQNQYETPAKDYQPLPVMGSDPDFRGYKTFPQRWSQEVSQMKTQATKEGETRLYYTGMAQAMLLDRLAPGWKEHIFTEGTWLETLLVQAP